MQIWPYCEPSINIFQFCQPNEVKRSLLSPVVLMAVVRSFLWLNQDDHQCDSDWGRRQTFTSVCAERKQDAGRGAPLCRVLHSVQILHWTSSTTIWAQKKIAHKQGSTQGLHWASKCSTLRFQQSGVECRCFSEKAYFAIWRNTFCVEEYISF